MFRTKDGHINIASAGGEIWKRMCEAIGQAQLVTDPEFNTPKQRLKNRYKLNAIIEEVTQTRTSAEWIDILNRAGCPCGPIYQMDQVFADPQVKHLGIAQPVEHTTLGRLDLVGQAVTLSRTPSALRSATPERGEHTDEVLRELGYDAGAIARLRQDGVI